MITVPRTMDYAAQCMVVSAMQKKYPQLSVRVLGRSRAGRAVFLFTLGEGEPVLLCGGFHGSEWLTQLLLFRFTESLCTAEDALPPNRKILIVPCVNPDGTEIFLRGAQAAGAYAERVDAVWDAKKLWNANAAGVDINHNFDAGWKTLHALEEKNGITGAAPRQYGGPYAESEPETQMLCDLCRREQPCRALAFHSQGEEIFWRYGKTVPPQSEALLEAFVKASGYKPVRNAGLYAHGGFKDWFIETFQKPAFTVEIGRGRNPLPLGEFETIWQRLREMLMLSVSL